MICIYSLTINYLLITRGSYRVRAIFLFFFSIFQYFISNENLSEKSELGAQFSYDS